MADFFCPPPCHNFDFICKTKVNLPTLFPLTWDKMNSAHLNSQSAGSTQPNLTYTGQESKVRGINEDGLGAPSPPEPTAVCTHSVCGHKTRWGVTVPWQVSVIQTLRQANTWTSGRNSQNPTSCKISLQRETRVMFTSARGRV